MAGKLDSRALLGLVALLALAACRGGSSAPASRPAEVPRRVVALAPSLTEIAADLGAAGQLVGLSSYGRVPAGAEGVERVGGFIDPSIERIIALRPDLVIGVPLQRRALDSCRAAGLRTLEVDCQTIEDALAAYRTLGAALGHEEAASSSADRLEARLAALRRRSEGRPRPRSLLLLGRAGDDLQQIYPVARGNFAHQLLEIAGGQNVLDAAVPSISAESIIALAPEVIVELAMDEVGEQGDRALPISPIWARLSSVPAVRDGRVHAVASASLLQPGPRMADGAELLYRLLHGPQPSSP